MRKTQWKRIDCETDEGDGRGGVVMGANGGSLLKVFICPVKIISSSFYTVVYICCIEKRKTYYPQGWIFYQLRMRIERMH